MCGIVGGVGDVTSDLLDKMLSEIQHRGPDNTDTYHSEGVGLGHARLSIIDLSESSNQPLWDTSRTACIVFNGEIYNYKKLREELLEGGVSFSTQGDAEVLLNTYLKYGVEGLKSVSGIFSFAIWVPERKELFLARDPYGVKPLYYLESENKLYFSSEMKSLIPAIDGEVSINKNALLRTLICLWSPGEETIIAGIKKIKPAYYMKVLNGAVEQYDSYWEWPDYKPNNSLSEQQHSVNTIESIEKAVGEQLVSDVEVGTFLSGGLDSSLLTALASREIPGIKSFTIDSNEGSRGNDGFSDDLPYAKAVASFLKSELNILKASPDITKLLPKMVYHLDELQADPAPLNVLLICEEARRQGIKVLLSGAGGDDIFSGYRRHYAVTKEKYWAGLPKVARRALKGVTSKLSKQNPSLRRVSKAFQYADLEGDERLLSYFFWLDPSIAKGLFVAPEELVEKPFEFITDELNTLNYSDPLEKMLYLERKYFLVDHNFNYTDKMSMAAGVEVRVPFLDKGVIDVASSIPSSLKQKGKVGKSILKKASESILPIDVIYRSKSGFGAPLRSWLKNELSDMVDELLSQEKIQRRGIFKYDAVKDLIEKDRKGIADYSYPIFALLCFEIWCQQFLD
ncbi:asparagine synthase (glutamine-hydrolyzing) [Vibrio aquaticus]|uniref:asparagine synthase (glutamine-hydrolyzing) n=1 Tax=Vibrio aquaticus TaxID=2496559 RepID=A0A432CTP3_9VIBR|nr:asparagine synthase (glutamine-hydrolyzing) [Vibrio aquaticus]RTZ14662.1 asparagine synthase (glutamine-hydrolyzing) [Vibrio aquaticus]